MNTKQQHNWSAFLNYFSEQNKMRPTRLGVFENAGDVVTDYWLEDGLPLAGIDVDTSNENFPSVEIMLGGEEKDSRQMTHIVRNVRSVKIILSVNGKNDGMEIEDTEGKTTFLCFEN